LSGFFFYVEDAVCENPPVEQDSNLKFNTCKLQKGNKYNVSKPHKKRNKKAE